MLQSLPATAPDISARARWVNWLVCRLHLSNTKISKVNFFTYHFAFSHRSELPSEFEDNDLSIIFNNKPKQNISFRFRLFAHLWTLFASLINNSFLNQGQFSTNKAICFSFRNNSRLSILFLGNRNRNILCLQIPAMFAHLWTFFQLHYN